MDQKRDWPNEMLSCFEGSMLRQLNQLYILILSPLCVPTYFSSKSGTTVAAYLTEEVRAKQEENLKQYARMVREALEPGGSGEQPSADQIQKPEIAVKNLMDEIRKQLPETHPNIGKDLICRAGNRFLSAFALENGPQCERIRAVKDYYRLCIDFFCPEDHDETQKKQLCERLLAELKNGGVWRPEFPLPEDPAERAAHLLLAYLFLKYYMLQTLGTVKKEVREQLQKASVDLGFVNPSAQSRRFVQVDAQVLQKVIVSLLDREILSWQDARDICSSITQILCLLKDGDAILPGFSQWLDKAEEKLGKIDEWLRFALKGMSDEEQRGEIKAVIKITRDLLNTILDMM